MFNTNKLKYKFITDDQKHKQFILQNEDKSKDAPKKLINQKVLIDMKQSVKINDIELEYTVHIDNDTADIVVQSQTLKQLAILGFNAQWNSHGETSYDDVIDQFIQGIKDTVTAKIVQQYSVSQWQADISFTGLSQKVSLMV